MTKLIIWVGGKPSLDGYKKRDFAWSEPHKKFIYLGREIADTEFNELFEKAHKHSADLLPRVAVVGATKIDPEITLDDALGLVRRSRPELFENREPSIEDAQRVLMKKAPHLLRKNSQGRVLEVA